MSQKTLFAIDSNYATDDRPAIVYLVFQKEGETLFKIGKTEETPEVLLRTLQRGCPYELAIRVVARCDSGRTALKHEASLHKHFRFVQKQKGTAREWFDLVRWFVMKVPDPDVAESYVIPGDIFPSVARIAELVRYRCWHESDFDLDWIRDRTRQARKIDTRIVFNLRDLGTVKKGDNDGN